MNADIRIYPDLDTLSRAIAGALVDRITGGAAVRTGRFSLALAGGSTPRRLYRVLVEAYRERVPWARLHLFWGDERYVPPDDPRSNYRLVRESLLEDAPIPAGNVHPMPTHLPDPGDAARAYEGTLRAYFSTSLPRLDLVLLGMGPDGHTASLFPHSPALDEQRRWVVPVHAPIDPPVRLTVTLPVLNNAACVFFLVAGAEKAEALRRTLAGTSDPDPTPASAIRPPGGRLVWWVDEKAVALVARSPEVLP